MRVGIMGGTLDPIHHGHIQVALHAKAELGLDRVMLLPAGDPPHKTNPISGEERLEMVRLAAETADGLFPCAIEVRRCGTTYTVDTLTWLKKNNPGVEWYYLVGADTLDLLDTWRNFPEVAKLCVFAVSGRADEVCSADKMRELGAKYGARFEVLNFSGPEISSTEIRDRAAAGRDISDLVPPSVADYITRNGLYLCPLSEDEILEKLKATLKPTRLTHTIGVAETAQRLAERFGVSPAKARLTGLLHDCAKYIPYDEMVRLVRENVPDADAAEMMSEPVLHAPAGSVLAAREYGIRDPEILSAIRKHTLGGAEMTPLEALIYVSDFIEPNRPQFRGIEEVRALAETDIFAAMRRCAWYTCDYIRRNGKEIHPRVYEMLRTDKEEE